jgi:hypothetical protein
VTPLAPARYKLELTMSEATREKLRLAQEMLRHALPSGEVAEIVDRALTLLLEDLARKKFAATDQPRPSGETAPGSRHIPAAIKRAVWLRDLGRCTFVVTNGRCTARGFLEFHHVIPYAAGGEATVAISGSCANPTTAMKPISSSVCTGPETAMVSSGSRRPSTGAATRPKTVSARAHTRPDRLRERPE